MSQETTNEKVTVINKRIKYEKGLLEFKLHPFFAFGAFIIFLVTVGGAIFAFVDANYKGKIDNKEAEVERLSQKLSNSQERIAFLSKDSLEFISLKNKLRSADSTGISPKELIAIDSLSQATLIKDRKIESQSQQLDALYKTNQQLISRINALENADKNKSSKATFTKATQDTIIKLIIDTVRVVDTFYLNVSSSEAYYNLSNELDQWKGFQDPTGFALGIVNWSSQKRTADVTIIRPGDADSKIYKGVSVGTSWTGTAANVKYIMSLVDLIFYQTGDIGYRVKVSEVPN